MISAMTLGCLRGSRSNVRKQPGKNDDQTYLENSQWKHEIQGIKTNPIPFEERDCLEKSRGENLP
jgi:hypothetical protein